MSSAPCGSAPASRTMTLFEGVQLMLCRISKVAAFAGLAALVAAAPALAQAPAAAAPFTPTADMVNKGDTAWMLTCSALVLMMSVPCAGLVLRRPRAREEHAVGADAGPRDRLHHHFDVGRLGLFDGLHRRQRICRRPQQDVPDRASTRPRYAATFSTDVYIPEYVYVIFQMTFACITPALDRRRLCGADEVLGR